MKPSDTERSELPDCTFFYLQELEEELAEAKAENEPLRRGASCKDDVHAVVPVKLVSNGFTYTGYECAGCGARFKGKK